MGLESADEKGSQFGQFESPKMLNTGKDTDRVGINTGDGPIVFSV